MKEAQLFKIHGFHFQQGAFERNVYFLANAFDFPHLGGREIAGRKQNFLDLFIQTGFLKRTVAAVNF